MRHRSLIGDAWHFKIEIGAPHFANISIRKLPSLAPAAR
jgi:hypothetical protein